MSNLGNAYALAVALYARDKSLPLEEMGEQLYYYVDVLEFGQDERKADLYAQLAEKLKAGMPFALVVSIIKSSMDLTDRSFPHA